MLDYPVQLRLFLFQMIQSPVCLTIAGSDPSGGAGIQGDLKTFAAHRVYGMAVITALTAQNTKQVTGVLAVRSSFVVEQLQTLYDDIPADFVKAGMLLNASIITAVAEFFRERNMVKLVVDPVMISSSGAQLLRDNAIKAYIKQLFPLAALVTPNNLETRHFSGIEVKSVDDAVRASEIIRSLGAENVLVKGGDTRFVEADDKLFDVLNEGGNIHVFERPLVGTRNSHGTGCAMAAAICSRLATGYSLPEAVDLAGIYVGGALRHAYKTGQGSGSINHLFEISANESRENR